MKRYIISLTLFLTSFLAIANNGIPDKPKTNYLLNDLANILTQEERIVLEKKLLNYYVKSSTQVAVVIVNSLNGYECADFATRLAQKWGIGSAKNDNGILLLVKPKTNDSKGEVFIAVGYGLEGVATDLANGQIVREIIIPEFKRNNYFRGIDAGTNALIDLTRGEYNDPQTYKPRGGNGYWIFIIIIIFMFMSFMKRKKGYQVNSTGVGVPTIGMFPGFGRSTGSFQDFSSTGGGSFQGFGGFGGGSFGGGGAGGSW